MYPIVNFDRIRICGKVNNVLSDDGKKIVFRGSEVGNELKCKDGSTKQIVDSFLAFDFARELLLERKVCCGCILRITAQMRQYLDDEGNIRCTYVIRDFDVADRPEWKY